MSYNQPAMAVQELTVERYEGVADDQRILLLRGPITMETAPQFERAVHHECADTMILDLSDVPYIDSVGLGSLVAAYVSPEDRPVPRADWREAAGEKDHGYHEGERFLRDLRHHVGSRRGAGQHRYSLRPKDPPRVPAQPADRESTGPSAPSK